MPRIIDLTDKVIKNRTVLSRGPNVGESAGWYVHCHDCGKVSLVSGLSLRQGHGCACVAPRKKPKFNEGDSYFGMKIVERLPNQGPLRTFMAERPCGHRVMVHGPATVRYAIARGCHECGPEKFEYEGRSLTAEEWADELGIAKTGFMSRIRDYGRDNPRTFTAGRLSAAFPRRPLSLPTGEVVSEAEAARLLGVTRQAIDERLKRGWPEEVATTTPKYETLSQPRVCPRCREIGHKSKTCEWHRLAKSSGLPVTVVVARLRRGWSVELATMTPMGAKVCRSCGVPGHIARTCGRERRIVEPGRHCRKCGQLGHNARTCAKHHEVQL